MLERLRAAAAPDEPITLFGVELLGGNNGNKNKAKEVPLSAPSFPPVFIFNFRCPSQGASPWKRSIEEEEEERSSSAPS